MIEKARGEPGGRQASAIVLGVAGVGFLLLLVLALEGLQGAFGTVIPPAVLAMALLTLFFVWYGRVPGFVAQGAGLLFRVFPLLFIPPLVAIIRFADVIAREWLILLLVVSLSTFAGLVVTAVVYRIARQWGASR